MTDLPIDFIPSPNNSSRRGHNVIGTIIHYTAAGPARGSIRWFQMPESQASVHYVIARDGDITRMVKLTRKAWHAGNSEMFYNGEMKRDANLFTIGIELANCGLLIDDGKENPSDFWWGDRNPRWYIGPDPVKARLQYDNGIEIVGWWEPYPAAQLKALQLLLFKLSEMGYRDAACNLMGHEEIAMPFGMRKKDPGPLFPWERFPRKHERRTKSILSSAHDLPGIDGYAVDVSDLDG